MIKLAIIHYNQTGKYLTKINGKHLPQVLKEVIKENKKEVKLTQNFLTYSKEIY